MAILMIVAQSSVQPTWAAEGDIVIGPGIVLPAGTVIHTQEVYAVRGDLNSRVTTTLSTGGGTTAPKASATGGRAEAEAAGLITVTEDSVKTPAAGPTYNFQQAAQASSAPAPQPQPQASPVRKGGCSGHGWKHFCHRCACFFGIGASASVSVGAGMAPPMRYPAYWEENNSYNEYWNIENTRRLYSGYNYPDQVFSYGYGPSYYSSWAYVPTPNRYLDNSSWVRPFPPVRYINDAPRPQPSPHYQSYPQGGGHGGRGGRR